VELPKNMEQLNQDFLEFIGFLEEEKVDYLVIGKVELIRNKAASGRAKDLIDLEELKNL
jgi:hypothetical protein